MFIQTLYDFKIKALIFLKIMLCLAAIGSIFQLSLANSTDSTEMVDAKSGSTDTAFRLSAGPYLQLPENMKNWPAISPSFPEVAIAVADPGAVVEYNVSTGVVTKISSSEKMQYLESPGSNTSNPNYGLLPLEIGIKDVLPPDDRSQITSTTDYPWRTIVKLYITFPDESYGVGSGAIVGIPGKHIFHVLTAGHCVHDSEHGGWASSILVVPALSGDYMPYCYGWATYLRSYTGWTDGKNSQDDWGVITLDRNFGDWTGWVGLETADPSNPIYTGTKNIVGYPVDKPDGTMWYDADNAHSTDEYNHWYYMDTYGGMSGGPVWRYVSSEDERYILATHTCGTEGCGIDGKGVNHGTRLNQDKFNALIYWCDNDTAPVDKADLVDDGDFYSGFSPTTISPGADFHVWSDVYNIGTASSGGFYVHYYASIDNVITTSDYLIGSAYVGSISPFAWNDSDWTGAFPSIPSGSYYVGWIIDSTNVVSEFDEGNNIACKESYLLNINPEVIPVYRMYSPSQTDHFYTTNYYEYSTIAPAVGYIGEGILGNIYDSSQGGTIPVYRMYSPSQTDHFYTTNYYEYSTIAPAVGYLGEGTLGNIYGSSQNGTVPVYRMYSPSQTDHFYTTNYYEYSAIAPAVGYIGEGILGYIQPIGLAKEDDLRQVLVNDTSMERGNVSAMLLNEEI